MKTKFITILALLFIMSAFLLPMGTLAEEAEQSELAIGVPFTPDGVATVIDNATDEDGKEFFTFETPAGNTFFLVIDRSRAQDNVYFLNAVTEQDLMALTEEARNEAVFQPSPTEDDFPESTETNATTEAEGNGTLIFILIAVAVFGVVAYYIKIVRPKKQGADFDDEDEYEPEDDDELEFEPEIMTEEKD